MYKPGARAAAERTCGWRVGRRNRGGAPGAVVAAAVATTDPRSPEYDGSAIAGGGSGVESGNRAESRLLDGFFVLAQSVWAICRYRLVLPPRAHPRAGVVPRTRHSPWATLTNALRVGSVPSPGLEVWVPSEHLVVFDGESFDTAACEEMLSSATVRPLAHALRLQTPASRLSASPVRFASSLAGRRRDPHEVLGVLPGVSKCELKKAFHRSSWSWHPDRATPSDRPAAEVRPRCGRNH